MNDKQMHFGISAFTGIATGHMAKTFYPGLKPWQQWMIGTGIGMIPGIAKGVFDCRRGGSGWDWDDMKADAYGASLGSVVFTIRF